jgi:hypothetical protein
VLDPPAEGRLIFGQQGLAVGDALCVELVSTNVALGHVDFGRC